MHILILKSVRMGNSIQQHRCSIGNFYSRACRQKTNRNNRWKPEENEDNFDSWQACQILIIDLINLHIRKWYFCQVSAARLLITVLLLCVIEMASFGVINMILLTRSGIETNPGPANPSIGDTLAWLDDLHKDGKVTEEKLKSEAQIFFSHEIVEDKKGVKKKFSDLVLRRKKQILTMQRELQIQLSGKGKHGEIAPDDFFPDIDDQKERNSMFTKMCRADAKDSEEYKKWLEERFDSRVGFNEQKTKAAGGESESGGFKLVRERSSGCNIFDTAKTSTFENSDGTVSSVVLKETWAKVTIRPKRKSIDDNGMTCSGQSKRARAVSDILDHYSEQSPLAKAQIVSKIIDREGADFGKDVFKKSKVLQTTNQLDAEQTASLITLTRSSEYLWRQSRTAFNKELGFSPISSQRKVDKFRDSVMPVRREDWNFLKKNIYKNKQGKNREIPSETIVLLVKDLTAYVTSMAENEKSQLDLTFGELPVCFDADGGGGRFVATFAFLNRIDGEIKLHPFTLYEGSDNRKNMEMTMGNYTEDIKNMEGKQILINGKSIKLKLFCLFDLCALNNIIGKQNHSSRFPCAWTNVTKDHLHTDNHNQIAHTKDTCKEIRFLDMKADYETNFTHHAVKKGDKNMAKSGKDFGSIVGTNLFPLANVFRYIPPLMHLGKSAKKR